MALRIKWLSFKHPKSQEMRYLLFILPASILLVACSSSKPAVSGTEAMDARSNASVRFINNISIKSSSQHNNSPANSIKPQGFGSPRVMEQVTYSTTTIETYNLLQFKYAILMDEPVEEMNNEKLLQFIDEWYGAKYHFGGNSKEGIDCSAFVSLMMSSVYGINSLPRVSKDQFTATSRISKKELREGDLVFFHTCGQKKRIVTHVGVYLRNHKFIHASVSGVMISDMSVGYYSAHYVGAGRTTELSIVSSR
jgi:cell wall-associated NlpC family hydrolase